MISTLNTSKHCCWLFDKMEIVSIEIEYVNMEFKMSIWKLNAVYVYICNIYKS